MASSSLKQGGLETIAQRAPRFLQDENMSRLSGLDEWDAIERFNALAEEHDKCQRKYQTQNNQKEMQESLKQQIQEKK